MSKKQQKPNKKRKAVKKNKNALVRVISPIRPEVAFYVASEQADDRLIEQEVTGQVGKTMIYEFCPNRCDKFKTTGKCEHKTIKGLSKNGVDEVVRRINRQANSGSKIRISPERPMVTHNVEKNGERGVEVMVYAEDLISGSGNWGAKFEPYVQYGKPNTFAFEKALSKAQRNAKRTLIPEQLAIEVISKLIKETPDAVKQIEAPKTTEATIEPQTTANQNMYAMSLKRIEQIASDKVKLKKALESIPKLKSLTEDQRISLTLRIEECLSQR